jgi:hypothetical protein
MGEGRLLVDSNLFLQVMVMYFQWNTWMFVTLGCIPDIVFAYTYGL